MKSDKKESSGGKIGKPSNKIPKQNTNANLYDKGSNTPGSTAPKETGGPAYTGFYKESM